jgi:DNA-binding transcriptional LysR family regulator
MLYTMSNLSSEHLKAVQNLENEIGTPLVAVSKVNVEPAPVADETLNRLRRLEQEIGVVLVAAKPN